MSDLTDATNDELNGRYAAATPEAQAIVKSMAGFNQRVPMSIREVLQDLERQGLSEESARAALAEAFVLELIRTDTAATMDTLRPGDSTFLWLNFRPYQVAAKGGVGGASGSNGANGRLVIEWTTK